MHAIPDRWEHGSEFHWSSHPLQAQPDEVPWTKGVVLGCGRDALRLLAAHGRLARGWKRLWVPSYLCQEVVHALLGTGVPVAVYPDGPMSAAPVLPAMDTGDALLLVNYFGLRPGPSPELPLGIDLVEDHTHDPSSPWARTSKASFCMASLRKTLPVPDGGVLWSPCGQTLPEQPGVTAERAAASSRKLAAMLLKSMYLAGHSVQKQSYRDAACLGEERLAAGAVSGMPETTRAMLPGFPLEAWRSRRRRNHALLRERFVSARRVRVLEPYSEECVPFSAILVFDEAHHCEDVRRRLTAARIYPAVLWPLTTMALKLPEEALNLSQRLLSIHCDQRYGSEDMERVAAAMADAGVA